MTTVSRCERCHEREKKAFKYFSSTIHPHSKSLTQQCRKMFISYNKNNLKTISNKLPPPENVKITDWLKSIKLEQYCRFDSGFSLI